MPTDRWHIRLESVECESQEMTSIDLKVLERTGEWSRFVIVKTYSSTPRRCEKILRGRDTTK